jgi:hypothetical protein
VALQQQLNKYAAGEWTETSLRTMAAGLKAFRLGNLGVAQVRDRSAVTYAVLEQLGRDFDFTGLHVHDPWGTFTHAQLLRTGAARATVSGTDEAGTPDDSTQPLHYVKRANRQEMDVILSNPNPAVMDYAALVASRHARTAVIFRVPQSYLTRMGSAMMSWVRDLARRDRLHVIDGSTRALVGQWLVFAPMGSVARRVRPGAPLRTLI